MREPKIRPPRPWTTPCRGTMRRMAVAPAGFRDWESGSLAGVWGRVMGFGGLGWSVGVERLVAWVVGDSKELEESAHGNVFLCELVLASWHERRKIRFGWLICWIFYLSFLQNQSDSLTQMFT
jgi:hypothetical protein